MTYETLVRQASNGRREGALWLLPNFTRNPRAKIGEDAANPIWIFILHGVGYRMPAPDGGCLPHAAGAEPGLQRQRHGLCRPAIADIGDSRRKPTTAKALIAGTAGQVQFRLAIGRAGVNRRGNRPDNLTILPVVGFPQVLHHSAIGTQSGLPHSNCQLKQR